MTMDGTKPIPDPTARTMDQMSREVEQVKELFREKFTSIETQFALVERQRVEQKIDTATAVAAALSAAKEAVREQTNASEKSIAKSEKAFGDQLSQLTLTFTTAIGGVTDGLTDMKERVGKIESRKEGAQEAGASTRSVRSEWMQAASLTFLGLSVVMTAVIASVTHGFH